MNNQERKIKAAEERVITHTRMMAGPDGNSLLCGKCGNVNYVTVPVAVIPKVACPECGRVHIWAPESVVCANPDHNSSQGCSSVLCWKRRKGLKEATS